MQRGMPITHEPPLLPCSPGLGLVFAFCLLSVEIKQVLQLLSVLEPSAARSDLAGFRGDSLLTPDGGLSLLRGLTPRCDGEIIIHCVCAGCRMPAAGVWEVVMVRMWSLGYV